MSTADPAGAVADEAYAAGYRDGCVEALREAASDVPLFEFMLVMDIAAEVAPAQIAGWLRARATAVDAAREDGPPDLMARAWDEGLDAGRRRWMDAREFGDAPVNPYRTECATCSGRGVWMDESCHDCASPPAQPDGEASA